VIVPTGLSPIFLGRRVRVYGEWRRDLRRKYILAATVELLEEQGSLSDDRLKRMLGTSLTDGEQDVVRALLRPALEWLLTSGSPGVAKQLAAQGIGKAKRIARNPFLLWRAKKLDFDTADCVYRLLQPEPAGLVRVQAAVTEVLRRAEKAGRARVTESELQTRVRALLSLPEAVSINWDEACRPGLVARDGETLCAPSWYHQRRHVLQTLKHNQLTFERSPDPRVQALIKHRFAIVTGPAGSGKTTLLKRLKAVCEAGGWRVAVTAMTGKAASVLGEEAGTLHRLLGYGPKGFTKAPLPYDLVIVDEASMLTWPLLAALIRVNRGQIVFCCDDNQLPRVEGEPAFAELLSVLPTVELTAMASAMGEQAVRVETIRHASAPHLYLNLERLLQKCEQDGHEWQVLSPIKRYALGTVALNRFLQGRLNPSGMPVGHGFRMDDRVIIVRNNYDGVRPIYNGQMGKIVGQEDEQLRVHLETGHVVAVAPSQLELAYCLTVHKAQGSRYEVVCFILPEYCASEFVQDTRLRYVGLTRGTQATYCYVL
jgi:exodeoxyribonuclease V alpha subunit